MSTAHLGANQGRGPEEIRGVARTLARIRSVAWTLLVAQQAGRVLTCLLAAAVVTGVLDYFLRTPTWLRSGLWSGGLMLLGWGLWQLVRPALKFQPGLTEVALRIEQSQAGRDARLGGVLAAGLELGEGHGSEPVVLAAVERFGSVRLSRVISGARVGRIGATLALVLAGAVTLAVLFPALTAIGAERVLTPWSGAQWPKRTAVADATDKAPHARGTGLLLRAVVLKNVGGLGKDDTDTARVWGRYRLQVDGQAGPVRRVLLTGQNRHERVGPDTGENAGSGEQAREGALFEYLIEPWGMTPGGAEQGKAGAALATTSTAELEYWFETEDDRTAPHRVLLVEPPSVVSAVAETTPPAYAGAGGAMLKRVELGSGMDERAAAPAWLAGSRVRVTIELNKSIPSPVGVEADADARARLLRQTFGEAGAATLLRPDATVAFDAQRWTLEWTLRQSVRLDLHVEDEYHIAAPECAFSFTLLEDRPAAAAVTVPGEDRTVLPTASVQLAGEGRDDVGLEWTTLEYRIARPPGGSEGAPAEAGQGDTELSRVVGQRAESEGGALPRELVVSAALDLAALDVKSGDEVWVTARAADAYAFEGAAHEATRSAPRKLRIISQEQLIEQVWAELAGIRRSAMATDEEQSRLARDAQRGGEATRLERAQAGVSDRLSRDREALDRIQQRINENDLREDTLQQVMREAQRLLDQAGKSSVQAAQKLRDASAGEQQSGAQDQKARAEAERAQDQVRDDLAKLIDLLDQGQDTWATKRAIEKLLQDQKALREKTGKAGEQTTGKQREQLTREQRDELEKLSADQKSLAQQAADAVKQMSDNEPKLRKNDPAAADAMSQAARQAQQQQLTQKMEQAAQQVQENQTNRAQEEQEKAIQSMEQMLQTLQNSARNRDEVLRRKLASLIESLEGLIKDQEAQLGALMERLDKGDLAGLDRGMARLHQNTLGVHDEAAQGPRELQPVAELIQDAAGAQSAATVALRAQPAKGEEAKDQEDASLAKLKEAKALAERLDREAANRQAQRKRDELKRAYREALTEQMGLRAETEPLVGVEATRRTRATARTLGEREGTLQDTLAGLERETKELSEAVMFSFAHRRLDGAIGSAAKRLGEGEADRPVTRQQDAAIRVLQQVLQALEEASKKDDEFRQQSQPQQQGGGGQQGGGQMPVVPPMAEVKLLRSMQQEIAELTKSAAEQAESQAVEDAAGLQSDLAKQGEALLKKLSERRQRPPRPSDKPAEPKPEEPKPEGGGGAGGDQPKDDGHAG